MPLRISSIHFEYEEIHGKNSMRHTKQIMHKFLIVLRQKLFVKWASVVSGEKKEYISIAHSLVIAF